MLWTMPLSNLAKGSEGRMFDHSIEALKTIGVIVERKAASALRIYGPQKKILTLSTQVTESTATFQILIKLALLTQNDLLEATLDLARFHTPAARDIAKLGLANYFAGAALIPYTKFLLSAHRNRYSLEVLADEFGASFEQVCHRLSTLQRPDQRGVPFFSSAWTKLE